MRHVAILIKNVNGTSLTGKGASEQPGRTGRHEHASSMR